MTDDQMHVIYGQGTFLTDTLAAQGIDLFTKVRDAGVFAKNSEGLDEQAANQLFFSEKAAMIFEGSWSYSSLPASMADHVALGGMPILASNSPHPSPVMYGGYGKLVWVTRNGAKKMDAVEKFIKFLYSDDQLSKFIQSGGLRSPLVDLQPDPTKLNAFVVQAAGLNKITTVIDLTDNDVPQDKFDDLYRASSSAFIPGTSTADIEKTFAAIYAK
jgi:multiple sugar transport system substrate-binding protein